MSKNVYLKQNFLLEDTTKDGELSGKFTGVANSGKSVGYHSGYEELITDIEGLTYKSQIPVFLNHWHENIVGYATLEKKDGKLLIDGKISQATQFGKDVLNLAKDGFLWELSIGVSSDNYEKVKEKTSVNGFEVMPPATIIREGNIFEVSFVPIGADSETVVEIFNKQKGAKKMKIEFDKEKWEKFACGCGGTSESSLEDLEKIVQEKDMEDEEEKEMKAANAAMKEEIDALKAKLKEYEDEEMSKKVKEAAEAKGIKLSDEQLKVYASDKAKAEMFIEMSGLMAEPKKVIEAKFAKKVVIEKEGEDLSTLSAEEKSAKRRAKAHEMVKLGQAKDFVSALAKLPEEDFK